MSEFHPVQRAPEPLQPENKPLSPEWLRRLRDTNSEKDPEEAQDRREAALRLAKRFGLKISKPAAA